MRRCACASIPALAFLLVGFLLPGDATALEKTAVRAGDLERLENWDMATTCQVAYYNYCTGWIWGWSGWSPNDVIGVIYESCCGINSENSLDSSWEFLYTGAPPGWGFTGTIDVWTADENRCPVTLLANQNFYFHRGWNGHQWDLPVPESFIVTITFGSAAGVPAGFASDHPAAGPTGPQACGLCYPFQRLTHSYDYGSRDALRCPGEKLNDGTCDVEWLWDVEMGCPIGVEYDSWASIKALYR
jgi:hypothetical protein